ncbi:nucleotide-binding universal stress UspA family protein [Mucilaginibacter yixingensis]|uniref:Nucleotide-binding universal stress UspA family protein n=1 Tax=Mucilaginibacter yixingensis TaxID=1295612 RepID=A0A2T5J5H1_9SPHI|nr:universal stress protein [Mucilaginibacter yixingensis]PTQ93226.1 nucleotide-binding universal stress UspA family protein [Mucilaginibacter yixingensis]
MKKILIGVDDSKFADHAIAYGFELAQKLGAAVGLVHVIQPVPMMEATDTGVGMPIEGVVNYVAPELMDLQQQGSENMIDRVITKYGHGEDISHFTEFGPTAEGIVDCAKKFHADMIVVGTHSRTGLDRLFMGSVAEHVVRYSPVPVIVVPMPKEEEK